MEKIVDIGNGKVALSKEAAAAIEQKTGVVNPYKTDIAISNRTRDLISITTKALSELVPLVKAIFQSAYIDGLEFAVAEINARHGTNYDLRDKKAA